MEGTYKFGWTEDSSDGCVGRIGMPAGNALGATEATFSTEAFKNCADYCGLNFLTHNGNII
jgi:hypothetical protein